MYDLPGLEAAHNALWGAIAARLRRSGIDAPESLNRNGDLDGLWRAPGLVLGQTCGYPLMTRLRAAVRVVATPRYRAEGCEGATHRSAIVVAADSPARRLLDLRGGRCAVNSLDSNTGMNLLRSALAEAGARGSFFQAVRITGSHQESLRQVADGHADVAAIDAVTLAYLRNIPSLTAGVRLLEWTEASPGLPFITHAAAPPGTIGVMQQVLLAAASDPDLTAVLQTLRIDGFDLLTEADYEPILRIESRAVSLGYPTLQ
jgi:ABC-type phosphate/phosphonate transport system substrate-binding protein